MKDYIKPILKLSPKQKSHHCVTKNLPSSGGPESIVNNIRNLAINIKTDTPKVRISGKIPSKYTFNLKRTQVNKTLKKICKEENIPFISHYDINTRFHLNSQ